MGLKLSPALLAVLLVGATIAALAPFDVALNAATFGSPYARFVLLLALGIAGSYFAGRAGLKFTWSAPACIAAAVTVSVYVVAVDLAFRSSLPPSYVAGFKTVSLSDRLIVFMLRAYNEEILYRLFVFSGLAWLATLFRPKSPTWIVLAMIAAQAINIALNVAIPSDPGLAVYDGFRLLVPGVVWAWVYYRFGFFTSLAAHVGAHLILQPLLGAMFGG